MTTSNMINSENFEEEDEDEKKKSEVSVEKLNHFIEIGFLMDKRNFNFMKIYNEETTND